jgi:precorrin isomerase
VTRIVDPIEQQSYEILRARANRSEKGGAAVAAAALNALLCLEEPP